MSRPAYSLPIAERRLIPCGNGHSREDAFEYTDDNGKPQLKCRKCGREQSRRWRSKHSTGVSRGRPRKQP